jgi:hypothetical protein
MKPKKVFPVFSVLLSLIVFLLVNPLPATGEAGKESARILQMQGEVFVKSERVKTDGEWVQVRKSGYSLFNGDEVRTGKGTAEIEFSDGSIINLSENTNIGINEGTTQKGKMGIIKVSMASFWAKMKRDREKGESHTTIIGTRGSLDRWSLAKIIAVQGEVFVKSKITEPKGEWVLIKKTDHNLYNGDEVRTEKGTAKLEFIDGSVVHLAEKTSIGIDVSLY